MAAAIEADGLSCRQLIPWEGCCLSVQRLGMECPWVPKTRLSSCAQRSGPSDRARPPISSSFHATTPAHIGIDVVELRVAIGMVQSLACLAVGLQTIIEFVQQLADEGVSDR